MCDECTWHHKTFLRQLYWHLAIKLLLYYIAGKPDVLTGISLCLCPSFSVSLRLCTGRKTPVYYHSVSVSLSVSLSVCLPLSLSLSLSLPPCLSLCLPLSLICACAHSLCVWGGWVCVGLGVCMCSCMTGCGKGRDRLLTWAFRVTGPESACIVIVSFSLADSL